MPPKFVPRQRKHKVLARQKATARTLDSKSDQNFDSNFIELVKLSKTEIQERKRQIKEELQKNGIKISSKKAKRLEKYLETKLRKDENRVLISQLTKANSDTSLYHSSSRLGQAKQTKRQRLERALKNQKAGISIKTSGDEIPYEERSVSDDETAAFSSDDGDKKGLETSIFVQKECTKIGAGLKRPLEMSQDGQPILKKKERWGGIVSKFSHKTVNSLDQNHSEWDSISSNSNMPIKLELSGNNFNPPETESEDELESLVSNESGDVTKENNNDPKSDDDSDEVQHTPRKERSSAFKAWAIQRINEAQGYQPIPNIRQTTGKENMANFKTRAPEVDPIPFELETTKNVTRKFYNVSLTRPFEIQQTRLKLPVVAEEQKIMEAIHNNNIVFISGTTGSGKTTQIPQFLFEAGYGSAGSPTPGIVGVTQPRRVAAVSMAKRVGDEMGDYQKKVAYKIRFEGTTSNETAIKFMTDGVLLREIAQDISLQKYSAIVIDEAHERSVNTDILIGMLSRIVKLRQEIAADDPSMYPLKFIIMSATLRISDFTENTNLFNLRPPVLNIEGRQHPVTCHFSRKTSYNYVHEAFKKVSRGHKKLPPGGFLVFLTSQNDISLLSKLLKEASCTGQFVLGPEVKISGKEMPIELEDIQLGESIYNHNTSDSSNDSSNDDEVDINLIDEDFDIEKESEAGPLKMHILPLYSLLPTSDQMKVFDPPPIDSRLVVLATNIAETSLTIPGIRYVFDCGRSKERRFDKVTGVQSFEVGWISKASAQQRAGRAGRTVAGHCYRLYSSAVYERDFPEVSEPEILRAPIEGVALQLKAMNLQHVVNFPFPTPPDREMLANSERLLKYLTAISATGKITSMGLKMSIFPLPPRLSRILLIGHLHDCLPYTIALVAGLSAPDLFLKESQADSEVGSSNQITHLTNLEQTKVDIHSRFRQKFNKVHRDFCFLDDKSDAIKLLQVVGEFAHQPTDAWCRAHFVRYKTLREIQALRRQITDLLRINIDAFAALVFEEKLDPPSAKQVKILKQMVATGYIDQVAIRADKSPNPPETRWKPNRAIDVPYLTLFRSNLNSNNEDCAVYIHPESPLAHLSPQECPEYIIYSYLQRVTPKLSESEKTPKIRMHALTDVTGNQIAAIAKGTPLLHYGKPLKGVLPEMRKSDNANIRECWVIPYLKPECVNSLGWPLPARKVIQKKVPGQGWIVE